MRPIPAWSARATRSQKLFQRQSCRTPSPRESIVRFACSIAFQVCLGVKKSRRSSPPEMVKSYVGLLVNRLPD